MALARRRSPGLMRLYACHCGEKLVGLLVLTGLYNGMVGVVIPCLRAPQDTG